MTVQATARADEIYASFEGAVERMEKQLRRYKRRPEGPPPGPAAADRGRPSARPTSWRRDRTIETEEPETLQPVIVAEMEARVPYLSVGEAVMQMELAARISWYSATTRTAGSTSCTVATTETSAGSTRAIPNRGTGGGNPSWSFRRSSGSTPFARR